MDNIRTIRCVVREVLNCTDETFIVVQDVDTCEYHITTMFKNWQWCIPAKDEVGYLEYEEAIAGVTEYYDKKGENAKMSVYKNTYKAFRKFVAEQQQQEDIEM